MKKLCFGSRHLIYFLRGGGGESRCSRVINDLCASELFAWQKVLAQWASRNAMKWESCLSCRAPSKLISLFLWSPPRLNFKVIPVMQRFLLSPSYYIKLFKSFASRLALSFVLIGNLNGMPLSVKSGEKYGFKFISQAIKTLRRLKLVNFNFIKKKTHLLKNCKLIIYFTFILFSSFNLYVFFWENNKVNNLTNSNKH